MKASIIFVVVWLLAATTVNADCLNCGSDSLVRLDKKTTIGTLVRYYRNHCDLFLNPDRIAEINKLGNRFDKSANVVIDSGMIIRIPKIPVNSDVTSMAKKMVVVKRQSKYTSEVHASEFETKNYAGPMRWQHFGVDRVTAPFEKVWPKMGFWYLPGVKEVFLEKYKNCNYKRSYTKKGDRWSQMASGYAKIYGTGVGVLVDPADSNFVVWGNLYTIETTDGRVVQVFKPDVCDNWCWRIIEAESVDTTKKVVDSTWGSLEVRKDSVVKIDTVKTATGGNNWEYYNSPDSPSPTKAPSTASINNRFCTWLSDDRPVTEPGSLGAQNAGLMWDCFLANAGRNSFGFTAMVDGGDGLTHTRFAYQDVEGCVGPLMVISLTPKVYWGTNVSFGSTWNWGEGAENYNYRSFQTNAFWVLGQTLDAMWSGPISHLSTWVNFRSTFATAKQSTLNGAPLTATQDPAVNSGSVDGGGRLFFFGNESSTELMLVYRGSYVSYDHSISNAVGAGVAFLKEGLTLEVCFHNRSNSIWSDNNGNTIESVIGYSFGYGRGRPQVR